MTPLHIAVCVEDMEIAQWLHGLGADIHKVDNVSLTY